MEEQFRPTLTQVRAESRMGTWQERQINEKEMGNMEELKAKVEELEVAKNDVERLHVLQQINEVLLTKYIIKIKDLIIVPLWVEAYYYDRSKFPDCNSHMSDKQKDRFGQLYFHESGRGGLDICLSDNNDCYLSVLLKATLVYKDGSEEYKTQTQIYDILDKLHMSEEDIEKQKEVLVSRENGWTRIIHAKRINLQKPCYKEELLAAVPIDVIAKYDMKQFARVSLAESAVDYMEEFIKDHPSLSRKCYERECRQVFGWFPDSVGKILKELA